MITVVGFLDTLIVPLSSDLCASRLQNPPPMIFPRVLSKMALVMTKLLKASGTSLCPFLCAYGHVSLFPVHLCGRIFLLAKFLPELCPQIKVHKGYAHEVHTSEKHPPMDTFFPDFLRGVVRLLRNARCGSVPRILCSVVKSTWISVAISCETLVCHLRVRVVVVEPPTPLDRSQHGLYRGC